MELPLVREWFGGEGCRSVLSPNLSNDWLAAVCNALQLQSLTRVVCIFDFHTPSAYSPGLEPLTGAMCEQKWALAGQSSRWP